MTAGKKMPNPRRKVIKVSGSFTITESRNASYEPFPGKCKFFFLTINSKYQFLALVVVYNMFASIAHILQ